MVAQPRKPVAHPRHVRRPAAGFARHEAPDDFLRDDRLGNLRIEFRVKPAGEPAHLCPPRRLSRNKFRLSGARLFQIFGDRFNPADRRSVVLHEDRHDARRIEIEKPLARCPRPLLDQLKSHAIFRQCQAHPAAQRIKGKVKQFGHGMKKPPVKVSVVAAFKLTL
jgi:hypothetical protein